MTHLPKNENNKSEYVPLDLANFDDRPAITLHICQLCPYLEVEDVAISETRSHKSKALERLDAIEPEKYGNTRNYIGGKVTHLSPYIRHGLLSLNHPVFDHGGGIYSFHMGQGLF